MFLKFKVPVSGFKAGQSPACKAASLSHPSPALHPISRAFSVATGSPDHTGQGVPKISLAILRILALERPWSQSTGPQAENKKLSSAGRFQRLCRLPGGTQGKGRPENAVGRSPRSPLTHALGGRDQQTSEFRIQIPSSSQLAGQGPNPVKEDSLAWGPGESRSGGVLCGKSVLGRRISCQEMAGKREQSRGATDTGRGERAGEGSAESRLGPDSVRRSGTRKSEALARERSVRHPPHPVLCRQQPVRVPDTGDGRPGGRAPDPGPFPPAAADAGLPTSCPRGMRVTLSPLHLPRSTWGGDSALSIPRPDLCPRRDGPRERGRAPGVENCKAEEQAPLRSARRFVPCTQLSATHNRRSKYYSLNE